MKRIVFTLVLSLVYFIAFCQVFPIIDDSIRIERLKLTNEKKRIVLDTDAYNEIDDQFALAYAILSEEKIKIEAIYAAPFHNSRSESPADGMEKSYLEIFKLVNLTNKSYFNEFVFKGSTHYLKEISQPENSNAVNDLILRAKKSTPDDPLYVVSIGCITNIANAILIEPQIINNIIVVWLGGNSLDWSTQKEFNLFQDILATRVIFNSGVPLVIIPCRPVASHFYTSIPELKYYLQGKSDLSNYLYKTFEDYKNNKNDVWSKEIWDVIAIAWLINPLWVKTNLVHCPVLTEQLTYSMDKSRHFVRMATSLNRDLIFQDLFLKLTK